MKAVHYHPMDKESLIIYSNRMAKDSSFILRCTQQFYCMHTKSVHLFLLVLLPLFNIVFDQSAIAQETTQITKTRVIGGVNVLISTIGKTVKYSSSLTDDKRKVLLRIANATVTDDARQVSSSTGLIDNVLLKKERNDIIVLVTLREASGYTATLLPYSRAISIDVFNWNSLKPAEEQYRSGLIAIEDNVLGMAKDYLLKAESRNHPDATAFVGLLSIKEGDYESGKNYLRKAIERKSEIPDIYGGLSHIGRNQGNDEDARKYEQEFIKRTGRAPYFDEERILIEKRANTPFEPTSLVFENPEDTSSITSTSVASNQSNSDSILSQLRTMQNRNQPTPQQTSKNQTASTTTSLLPSWISTTMLGIGISLIAVGILLIRSYRKWKRQQLDYVANLLKQQYQQNQQQTTQPIQQNTFDQTLGGAILANEHQAVNAYKQAGAILDNTISDTTSLADSKISNATLPNNLTFDTTKPKIEQLKSEKLSESEDALFDFDESIYKQHEERKRQTMRENLLKQVQSISAEFPDELFYQTDLQPQVSSEPEQVITPSAGVDFTKVDDTTLRNRLNSNSGGTRTEETSDLQERIKALKIEYDAQLERAKKLVE
jgi:tetratricopeptide (TPR) repeat protein